VQIGDENVHRVRVLMDEVFGSDNFIAHFTFKKSSSATDKYIWSTSDYLLWFGKNFELTKFRESGRWRWG
jgi:adenine-specific DNA-methyltransferase